MAETIDQLITQLEEKVLAELQGDAVGSIHAYEALQYVQSFVARKVLLVPMFLNCMCL